MKLKREVGVGNEKKSGFISCLVNSFGHLTTANFWTCVLFDILAFISVIIVLFFIASHTSDMLPEVYRLTPIAKDTLDLAQTSVVGQNSSSFSDLKENVSILRETVYGLFFKLVFYVLSGLVLMVFVAGFFNFLCWCRTTKQKFEFGKLFGFYTILGLSGITGIILVFFSVKVFKFPGSIVISFILIIVALYFSVFAKLEFMKNDLKSAFRNCLPSGMKKASLSWFLTFAALMAVVVLLFRFLSSVNGILGFIGIILGLCVWVLSRFCLADLNVREVGRKRFVHSKKGQITVFIILGVLILIGAIIFLLLRKPPAEFESMEEVTREVPMEVKPVQEFVQTCMYKTAKDAFTLVGLHGGYVDMADFSYSKKDFTLEPNDPTESDAAFFTSDKESHVAYWWFMNSKNSCYNCYFSDDNRPSFASIEGQVDTYIEDNLETCIGGFKSFEKEGFTIVYNSKPKPKTMIAERDVVVRLSYPVEVTKEGRSTNITSFISKLNLDFRGIYGFAGQVVESEIEKQYLERMLKHVLTLSSGIDFSALPPVAGMESSFVSITWSASLVKLQLQSLMTSYFPLMQINGTKDAKKIEFSKDTSLQNLYNPFFVEALNKSFPRYSVRFFYLNWPYYLHITPVEGETIKPSMTLTIPRGFGPISIPFVFDPLNYYEYFYDVSVPVIAEIKSYDEFFNETYTFFVATEVTLRDNLDAKDWFEGNGTLGPWDYSSFGVRGDKGVKESLELEEGAKKEDVKKNPVVSGNFTKTLFCNERQRISGVVEVLVTDKGNKTGVAGAEIYYGCGNYATCRMGITTVANSSAPGRFNSSFPVCDGGGILRIDKPGYVVERVVEISTLPGTPQQFKVDLEPVRKKRFTVKKFVIDRILFNDSLAKEIKLLKWNGALKALEPDDMLTISINKINKTPWEVPFSKFILWYGNDSKNEDYFKTLELVPGEYTLMIQYFYTNKTTILENCTHMCGYCDTDTCEKWCRLYPDKYESYCSEYSALTYALTAGIVPCATCGKCNLDMWQPSQDIVLNNQILGGFEINYSEPWKISKEDLDDTSKRLEFRFVHTRLPRCIDDLSEPGNITSFYYSNRNSLMPKFI